MEGIEGMIATTFLALAAAAQAPQGARQQALVVMPEDARQRQSQEQYGYADAVVSNGVVYLSGVPAYLRPGETDLEKAFTRVCEAMGKTLVRAGVTWDDVVQLTSVHTDVNAQIDAMVKVKHRYMKGKAPAWTAVGTNGLLQPGGIAEITLVAHVPRAAQ
jgi:enamine deaminase RidA (YjgF/YER057c/UK114 family)